MFSDHNPKINSYIKSSPDNFVRAGAFILASIQQPFDSLPEQLADIDKHGQDSRYLWAMKNAGYCDLLEKKNYLFHELQALYVPNYTGWIPAALKLIADEITGLGLVKAGFLIQLMHGQIGCIDTRNRLEFDIPLNTLKYNKNIKSDYLKYKKAADYMNLCNKLGTSEYLWDNWCNNLARDNPARFKSGQEVSELHYLIITGRY